MGDVHHWPHRVKASARIVRGIGRRDANPKVENRMHRGHMLGEIDFVVPIDEGEQIRGIADALRGAKQENALGVERIVENTKDLLLDAWLEIYEQIATAHEI